MRRSPYEERTAPCRFGGGIVAAAAILTAAALLGERIPSPLDGLVFGLGGMLLGLSMVALGVSVLRRRRTPEQHRQAQLAERDERNRTIREKAALTTWYWTCGILAGLYVAAIVLDDMTAILLLAAAIVMHCIVLLASIGWWNNKL